MFLIVPILFRSLNLNHLPELYRYTKALADIVIPLVSFFIIIFDSEFGPKNKYSSLIILVAKCKKYLFVKW